MEQDRINLLEKCAADTNLIEVGAVTNLFISILMGYVDKTETGGVLKRKLTEDEYVRLMTGLINSLLSSLYASAANTPQEIEERVNFVKSANDDVIIRFEQIKEEYGEMVEDTGEMDA